MHASLSDLCQEKEDNPNNLFLFYIFSRSSYLIRCRGSKLAFIHRVKENSKLVRTVQFCTLFPEGGVVWKIPNLMPGQLSQTEVMHHGSNSQRDATEIIINIKQFNSGQIASNSFVARNCMYMLYPLSNNFIIKNGLLE